jgi:ABC-type Fe3+/spermidine/putrescine transport system ATPase subunit
MSLPQPAPAGAPLLSVRSAAIAYGEFDALKPSSFDVHEGEFVTLLGPSGSGKTSLLRSIAGFVQPSAGDILLRGRSLRGVAPYQRNIGFVFQSYALFPHLSVGENIAFGLEMRRLPKAQIASRIEEVLQYVRLEGLAKRRTHELSGGQQQRVAIARALAIRPDLLLLDEPMSNLDALLRTSMQSELRALLRSAGVTALYVTHNQEEALSMSDRVVVMSNGAIRQIGTPADIYDRPVDRFVAGFIGQSNLFAVKVTHSDARGSRGQAEWGGRVELLDHELPPEAVLMIRPERIGIEQGSAGGGPNSASGQVRETSYLGDRQLIKVGVNGYEFSVSQVVGSRRAAPTVGQSVVLSWQADALVPVSPR